MGKTKIYITQRGRKSLTIPYRELSQNDRRNIIYDWFTIGPSDTRKKWNISSATLHHVRWHNKNIEIDFRKNLSHSIQALRITGLNSAQIAKSLNMSQLKVNELW